MTTTNSILKPKRRWPQFKVRTLLVLMLAVSLPLAWVVNERRKIAERQKRIGHWVIEAAPQPSWSLWLLGNDRAGYATKIGSPWLVADGDLHPPLNDNDLRAIQGLTHLESLDMNSSGLTDAGLAKLDGLRDLKVLGLACTNITDAGLVHLKHFPRLRELTLAHTNVTDAGLSNLKSLTQLASLELSGQEITDAGFGSIKHLKGLRNLHMFQTNVTYIGLRRTSEGHAGLPYYVRRTPWFLEMMRPVGREASSTHLRKASPPLAAIQPTWPAAADGRGRRAARMDGGTQKALPKLRLLMASVTTAKLPTPLAAAQQDRISCPPMTTANTVPKPKRRWPQFSVRAVLLLMVVIAGPLGWRRNSKGIAEITCLSMACVTTVKLPTPWAAAQQDRISCPPMTTTNTVPEPKRRWLQFSVRAVLLLMVVIAVPLGWTMHKVRQQRDAVVALESVGCEVEYRSDDWPPTVSNWLWKMLGDDAVATVISVESTFGGVSDAGLAKLRGLTQLKSLQLSGKEFTDAGLVNLRGLTQLESLILCYTQVTDAGLVHIQGLTRLRHLDLGGTQVTDAGLVNLRQLTQLGVLDLRQTKVAGAGLAELQYLPSLRTCGSSTRRLPMPEWFSFKD